MLIDIIHDNAEEVFLSWVEQAHTRNAAWSVLRFNFSKFHVIPDEEEVSSIIRSSLKDKQTCIYFCRDGDIFVTWPSGKKTALKDLSAQLYGLLPSAVKRTEENSLHTYYELQKRNEELQELCKRKVTKLKQKLERKPEQKLEQKSEQPTEKPEEAIPPPPKPVLVLKPSAEQIAAFQVNAQARAGRRRPEILIVEDQLFSNKLLVGMLEEKYGIHTAMTAEEGMKLYLKHAPELLLLDIELPDTNGHELAAIIHSLDREACIVMVTANNYMEDVTRAKENGAKGFVVKPYSKQKIFDCVHKVLHEKSKP